MSHVRGVALHSSLLVLPAQEILIFQCVSIKEVFCVFFGGLECVGLSFAYVAHFIFLGDVWIRTHERGTIYSPNQLDACATLYELSLKAIKGNRRNE